MPQPLPAIPGPASFLYELSSTSLSSGMHLLSKRSVAVADYLEAVTHVRQPGDLISLQAGYINRLMDDYASAASEAVAPLEQVVERTSPPPASPV